MTRGACSATRSKPKTHSPERAKHSNSGKAPRLLVHQHFAVPLRPIVQGATKSAGGMASISPQHLS